MYTTRRLNPFLCKGYSSDDDMGFLSQGDTYPDKKEPNPRHQGQQFLNPWPKTGQLEGYFGKFPYASEPYQDNTSYAHTAPSLPGFGSKDAHRRDEFTSFLRAAQWREAVKKENKFLKPRIKFSDSNSSSLSSSSSSIDTSSTLSSASTSSLSSTSSSTFLLPQLTPSQLRTSLNSTSRENALLTNENQTYSLSTFTERSPFLYDVAKSGASISSCPKCQRDTYYCKHRNQNQEMRRTYRTSACSYGGTGLSSMPAIKPIHGRRSAIKEFFDNNHI
eukprot:TRINITY_DN2672_c0_g1_i1.p1 TRINITY_DN2672_c0_g1~~TRINITY_DN2672_c0_g1_i1.p1  ORF type:complete len:276 (-),score=46.81 TRINITY_DN2672_c0_g1_i1:72-899(-)